MAGSRERGVCVFRGLPFAGAPVGSARFLPPRPAAPWEGVRAAADFGPAPPQIIDPLSELLGLAFEGGQDEDCLHLNVYTPAPDGAARPVLVWLHGGAFATGTGAAAAYDGSHIAERGNAVVVTLNYRVGALGFLHLAPLLAGARLPAGAGDNLGLQDQLAALRWVQREIAGFGGDPGRVTVFGESAGAGSLCALLAMPAARGLFARAIVQSAAPDGWLHEEEAAERARRVLAEAGLDEGLTGTSLLEKLQALPIETLLGAQQACTAAGPHRTGMYFAPVVAPDCDGRCLQQPPREAVAAGSAREVDLVIGTTREEMRLYTLTPGIGALPDPLLVGYAASRLGGDEATRRERAEGALAVHRARLADEAAAAGHEVDPRDLFFAAETDLSLRVPATLLAESHARHQPRTYAYLFTWPSPLPAPEPGGAAPAVAAPRGLGACHALDLPFTFGTLDREGVAAFAGTGPAAQALARNVMDAWIAFARTGDPSHEGIGDWAPYDADRRATMLLGERCALAFAPLEKERAAWGELP